MKLYADNVYGLSEYGDDSFVTEVVDEKTFVDALPRLTDNEYIRCDKVSKKTAKLLDDEYGIQK